MTYIGDATVSDQPWYADGLRFACSACGNCCTGAPGYVWVNKAEIEALAARLALDVPSFTQRYIRKVGIRRSLVELPNNDCVFFDSATRKCKVYDDRPRQCRTWPFWQSNVRTREAWQSTCAVCPGSGRGTLQSVEQIETQLAVIQV